MGEGECDHVEPLKKGRHRKKQLFNSILQQMEFYFGDSNLSKDRFLSQLINRDSYVDLNVFLSFNKIRKLNCTSDDLRKAISKSEIIELSEDKEKVCRKKPLVVKDNVEECTIYVENIKADADHEWLSHLFSDFGNVVYVSIPKYKHTKGNKGFAFIEFEREEGAQNALIYFESIGCKMPSDTNPDHLVSIKTFSTDNEKILHEKSCSDTISQKTDQVTCPEEIKSTKRKLSSSEDAREGVEKRLKIAFENDLNKKEDEQESIQDELQSEENDNRKKKKHKRDKKKNYIRDLGLKILSKKEWKKLRNRYLDLQRKKMKEFKQYLYKQKINCDKEKTVKENVVNVILEREEAEAVAVNEKAKVCKMIEFVSGVIVKVNLPKPCPDAKKFKNEIKSLSSAIKYVDIPLPAGSEEIFLRFLNNESAKQFCEQNNNTSNVGTKTILEHDEEKEYWEKIQNDRTVKISKNVKKQRGRDKLLKKAEKLRAQHLRFDEGGD